MVSTFRNLFPVRSRKGLAQEFKKLSNVVFKEDSKKGLGRPLGFAEFKLAFTVYKPEQAGHFSERDLIRIFACIDITSAGRITLFEFVRFIRVRSFFIYFYSYLFICSYVFNFIILIHLVTCDS